MLQKIKATWREFPTQFWIVVLATFMDMLGATLIFPFFALYITAKFNIGMTQAGVLLGLFSIAGLAGSMVGGALTDKQGRRKMVLFGLVFSALSAVSMGLVSELVVFYPLVMFVGLFSHVAAPAREAMVADMLPEEQRAEGFSILRVVANLSWIIGPTIGGLVASRSYLLLFILDAVMSLITAFIVYRLVPETRPQTAEERTRQTLIGTFAGYRVVLQDKLYVGFLIAIMLMLIVYQQMYNTLSVYLRDVHGVPTQGYGLLMSLNAGTIVLLQFWVTRKIKNYAPMLMMATGTAFYLVGFTMYGLVSTYLLFVVACLLITVGEMIVVPVEQAVVARFAPEDMRGRYMAFHTLAWAIPSAIGPGAAGLIMDNYDPRWIWYAGGVICAIAIAGFCSLHLKTHVRFAFRTEEKWA
jgi:MFS family permease